MQRDKARSLAISLGLHVAAFTLLMFAPQFDLTVPPKSPSEYQQAFAGKEDKIIWYKFKQLPDVKPKTAAKADRPLKAAQKAKQSMISSPKNAPPREQVILTTAPPVDLPPLDLPNMIAVKLPPKEFTTPPDVVRPEAAKIVVPDAPDAIVPPPLADAKLPATHLPPKQLNAVVPPRAQQPRAKIEVPTEAPSIAMNAPIIAGQPQIKLPSRAFVPPVPQQPAARRSLEAPTETTAVAMNSPAGVRSTLPQSKLPGRAYAPPQMAATAKASIVPPAPFEGPAGDLTIAIAGLNPSTAKVTLPPASSPGQFSAGEKVRPDGADADGSFKGMTVPDLFARSTDSHGDNKKSDLIAMRLPTTAQPAPGASAKDFTTTAATPHATATRVSSAPDPRFNGRDVYMMAIQMPNLTSYSGSWLMWYASRTQREADVQPIAAPVAHRKVDPKYLPSAVEDRAEGKVLLYCVIGKEGAVSSVQLVHGADERLNKSAEEALAKWEFYPATRNGQPVDVDVVVEIPFVLTPRTALR